MKRSEKEILDRTIIDSVIRSSRVCRLGLSDDGQPYVVPLCFGYDGKSLFLNCAQDGRKLDILRKNNRVCFEFDTFEGIVEAGQACGWGVRYQSVIGCGTAEVLTDRAAKTKALSLLMAQYSDRHFSFPEAMIDKTIVIRVGIDSLTGKQSKRLT